MHDEQLIEYWTTVETWLNEMLESPHPDDVDALRDMRTACRHTIAVLQEHLKQNRKTDRNVNCVTDALHCLAYNHECRYSALLCPYFDKDMLCDNSQIARDALAALEKSECK